MENEKPNTQEIEKILEDLKKEREQLREELINCCEGIKICKIADNRKALIEEKNEINQDIKEVDEEILKTQEFLNKILAKGGSDLTVGDVTTVGDVKPETIEAVAKEQELGTDNIKTDADADKKNDEVKVIEVTETIIVVDPEQKGEQKGEQTEQKKGKK